jgi:hypothetical protein
MHGRNTQKCIFHLDEVWSRMDGSGSMSEMVTYRQLTLCLRSAQFVLRFFCCSFHRLSLKQTFQFCGEHLYFLCVGFGCDQ